MSRSLKKRRLAALDTLFEINKEYVSEQQKEINVDNEKSFDKEKFILMLQSKNKSQATSGLNLFCKVASLQADSRRQHSIVKDYLNASPDCKEIVQYLNFHVFGIQLTELAFKTLVAILRQTTRVLNSKHVALASLFCQKFLKDKLRGVNGAFSLRRPDLTSTILDFLTLMVMHGKEVANLLLDKLSSCKFFMSTVLIYNSSVDGDAKQSVRHGVVRLAVSFLLIGDSQLIENFLYQEGFLEVVLNQTQYDESAFSIHLLLTTMLEKVLKNDAIAKGSKRKIFSRKGVLTSLTALFEWNGIMDLAEEKDVNINESKCDESGIHTLAYDFLHAVCCSTKSGVVADLSFTELVKASNHFLLLFLLDLNEKVSSVPLVFTLVVEIFHVYPSLLHHYFNSTSLNFQPSPSLDLAFGLHSYEKSAAVILRQLFLLLFLVRLDRVLNPVLQSSICSFLPGARHKAQPWFNNCRLLHDIYDQQPMIPTSLQRMILDKKSFDVNQLSQSVGVILAGIIPPVMDKAVLTSIISFDDEKVQLQGIKVIASSLRKLNSTLGFLKNVSNDKNYNLKLKTCTQLSNALLGAYKKQIPPLNTLMNSWKEICKDNVIDERETEMLQVLQIYQQTFFKTFDASNFDFCELLIGLTQVSSSESGRKSIFLILEILIPSVSKYKWFAVENVNNCPFAEILRFVVRLLHTSNDVELIDKIMQLIIAISHENKLLNHADYEAEMRIWLYFLSIHAELPPDNQANHIDNHMIDLFLNACSSVANDPDRYISKKEALMNKTEGQDKLNDSSLEAWIKQLPMLDIEHSGRAVAKTVPVEVDTHLDADDCAISNLLIAVYERIASINPSTFAHHFAPLDRWLSSTSIALFQRQSVFGNKLEQFVSILSSMLSKLAFLEQLSLLSTTCEKILRDDSSIEQFPLLNDNQLIYLAPNRPITDLQMTFVETEFASCLCRIHRVLSNTHTQRKSRVKKEFQNLTDQLFMWYTNIDIERDDVSESGDVTASSSKRVVMSKSSYVKLLNKLLNTEYLQGFFIQKRANVLKSEEFFNKFLTDLICKLLALKSDIPLFFKKNLKNILLDLLTSSSNFSSNAIFSTFDHWISSLNEDAIFEILSKTTLQLLKLEVNSNCLFVMCRCLGHLLEVGGTTYLVQIISKLFLILIKPDFTDNHTTLLSLLNNLLAANPSFALFANEQLLTWCLDRLEQNQVTSLLQALLCQNIKLQRYFLKLCLHDDHRKLKSLSRSARLLYLPISSFLLRHFHLDDSESGSWLTELVLIFKKHLFSALFDVDKPFDTDEASLLIWLIRNNHLSAKKLRKLNKKIPAVLQCHSHLNHRWEVARVYVSTIDPDHSENGDKLSLLMSESLMQLSCQLINERRISDIENVMQNLQFLLENISNWNSVKEFANFHIWKQFIFASLKQEFDNASVLTTVLELVKLCKCCMDDCDVTPTRLHSMLTHHSKFLQIMLSDDEQLKNAKSALVELLHEIVVHCDKTSMKPRDLVYLLGSYNASLSACDQTIYQIIQIYEWKGIPLIKYKPFFWGKEGITYYSSLKKKLQTLDEKPDANKVLDCINEERMMNTLKCFPITRRLHARDSDEPPIMDLCADDGDPVRYDPAFLLSILSCFLAPENRFNSLIILRSNIVPFLLRCLSSHCSNIRHLAAHCLLLCEGHFKATEIMMKEILLNFFTLIKNSLLLSDDNASVQRHPSVVTLYVAYAAQFFVQYNNLLRKLSLLRIFHNPRFYMNVVPNFIRFTFSHSSIHEEERMWMLEIVRDGMCETDDFQVAETSAVFRTLMSFHDSSICSLQSKKLILQIVARACKLKESACNFAHRLLPWLQCVISVMTRNDVLPELTCAREVTNVLKCFWTSISQASDRKNDAQIHYQLVYLLLGLLSLFQSNQLIQTDQSQSSILLPISDLLLMLNQVLDASKHGNSHVTLTFNQCEVVRRAAVRADDGVVNEIALAIIKHCQFEPSLNYDVESVVICLDWSLSRWMETQQRVADDVHILTWVLNSLRTINTESDTIHRLRSSLMRCYEVVCGKPRSTSSSNILKILHSMAQVLLHVKNEDDPQKVRTLLCRDVMA